MRAGDETREYTVDGVTCHECPVSAITPRSGELVGLYMRSKRLHDASGACLFGPDQSAWPAWAVDAFDTLEVEQIRLDAARDEALAER